MTETLVSRLRQEARRRLLDGVGRALALLDKSPLSRTAGSFDRKFWHYKIIDFPSGMQQELALPVAFVWQAAFDGNPYHRNERVGGYVRAVFDFHAASIHADGSLDDYFPYERALGATAYALAALTESALLTGLAEPNHIKAFERSGRFIASWPERGLLSNHYAIAACAIANLSALTHDNIWHDSARALVGKLAAAQHEEGWFPEYGGCDLGYQTVTCEFLARYAQRTGDDAAWAMLERLVRFLRRFLHPDGSFGGEYGSRNTYNFYPGGFALLSSRLPEAAEMLGAFAAAMGNLAEYRLADDGVFGHLLSSFVTTLRTESVAAIEPAWAPATQRRFTYYPGAQLFTGESGDLRIYGSGGKGGVLKVFAGRTLRHSDTGLAGRFADGAPFHQNHAGCDVVEVKPDAITTGGELRRFRNRRLGSVQMIVLRALALMFGRWPWYSHFIRSALQRLLIFRADGVGVRFRRTIRLEPTAIAVEDQIENRSGRAMVQLFRSTDCVNMHVIASDAFQAANLLSWLPLEAPGSRRSATFTFRIEETGA